jgi:hypothetical protein
LVILLSLSLSLSLSLAFSFLQYFEPWEGHVWDQHCSLTPIILAIQEAEIRRIVVWSQPRQTVWETLSRKKRFTKIGLVEWLKVQALSSNPSTAKKKKGHFLNEKRKKWAILWDTPLLLILVLLVEADIE